MFRNWMSKGALAGKTSHNFPWGGRCGPTIVYGYFTWLWNTLNSFSLQITRYEFHSPCFTFETTSKGDPLVSYRTYSGPISNSIPSGPTPGPRICTPGAPRFTR